MNSMYVATYNTADLRSLGRALCLLYHDPDVVHHLFGGLLHVDHLWAQSDGTTMGITQGQTHLVQCTKQLTHQEHDPLLLVICEGLKVCQEGLL